MDAQPVTLLLEEAFATASITRLVNTDVITRTPRWKLVRWLRGEGHVEIETMMGCPFCTSLYAALVVLALRRVPGGPVIRRALALRWLTGVLAHKADGAGADWPPELEFPPDRPAASYHTDQGTLDELAQEDAFWKRVQPRNLRHARRAGDVEAAMANLASMLAPK